MGTREQCPECGEFFIIGQEDEKCPHGQIVDEEKEEFELSNMTLSRADLEFLDKQYGKEISRKISDQQMKCIADKLSKNLTQDWESILQAIYDAYPEWFGVEEENDEDRV